MHDEIMTMLMENAREQLAHVDDALTELEEGGADIDEDVLKTIFRTAHSIKAGAGLLNLSTMRELAHALEGVLHLLRHGVMALDNRVIEHLQAGFTCLRALVASASEGGQEDCAAVADLADLAAAHLTPQQQAQAATTVSVPRPDGEIVFREDELGLRQALEGDKHLYLVEYDLVRDVQGRGKTPLDLINTMEASGLVVDCRMAPGDTGNDAQADDRMPFYMLFASIVEPDIVSYLFALKNEAIHPLDVEVLFAAAEVEPVSAETVEYGPWRLTISEEGAILALEAGAPPSVAEARQALLTCLERGLPVEVAWTAPKGLDVALLQVLVSAGVSFAQRGLAFRHRGGAPEGLSRLAERAGITPAALESIGLPDTTLFGGEPPHIE